MPEVVYFLVIVLVGGVVLRIAYLMGCDAAESEAFETIATLREAIRTERMRSKRLAEHLRRHTVGRIDPEVGEDLWSL